MLIYSFGTWLRRQRKAHDWTQAELAQRVGCALNTIAKIETDARRPSRALATRLALVLEIPQVEIAAVVQAARGALAVDRLPDPGWSACPAPPSAGAVRAPQRHQMRSPVPDFVGHQDALVALLNCLRRTAADGCVAAICGIRGMGGIGKTELAYLSASHLRDTFPDAQIVVDLRGAGSTPLAPSQAVQQVIHALTPHLPLPDDLDTLQRHYRSLLHGQRVLILADDARDSAQVRPLIPPPGSALLITSRLRFNLPGMTAIDLEVLEADEAAALLRTLDPRLGYHETHVIAQACGYLPLALRVSGGILNNDPALSAAAYLQQLADQRRRLHSLRDPDDPQLDVEAALRLSYARLDGQVQQIFRQLGVLVADFTSELAQMVVEIPTHIDITATLHQLLRHNLMMYDTERSRWRLHDLLRDLARHELEVMEEAEAAQWRYARATVALAEHIRDQYLAGGEQALLALAQFDTERAHIDAARRWAQSQNQTEAGDQLLIDAAEAIRHIQYLRYDQRLDIIPLWEQVRTAARRLGKRLEEGHALSNLGLAYVELGELQIAISYHLQRLAIARQTGDRCGECAALGNLGYTYNTLGELHTAINYHEQNLTIAREIGDRRSESVALLNLGNTYKQLGEPLKAISYLEQSLALSHELGDGEGQGITLSNLGSTYLDFGDIQRAIDVCEEALAITRKFGDRNTEGYTLGTLASAQAIQGHLAQASATFTQALALLREVSDRWGQAEAQWLYGLALIQQGERAQALPLLRATVEYEQEIGHTKAEEHAALLTRLEAGAELPPALHIPANQQALKDRQDESS